MDSAPASVDRRSEDDLSALAWVHGELRRSLEMANRALRRYLKEAEAASASDIDAVDPAVLRAARSQLHQGVGALELVGLPAVASVLRASETAVQRMIAKPAIVDARAVATIEQLSFALLDFLARQLAGKPVSPLMLFPQYRDALRLAAVERVHPADLWPMDWQWRELPPDPSATPRNADDDVRALLEMLVLWLMRQAPDSPANVAAAHAQLSDLFADIAAGARLTRPADVHLATFWQLAAAVFEAQAGGLLASDVYVKRLASRLLAQLRQGLQGEADVSQRLAQDLLFFCSQSRPPEPAHPAPRLAAVRRVWKLPDRAGADYETPRLGRFDPALLALARKRVAAARDSWSAVAGGELHRLDTLAEQFSLVGESLQRLLPDGDLLAQSLQSAVAQTVAAGSAPPPALAMEVATGILYVDASLEDGEFDHPELAERVQRLSRRIDEVRVGAEPQPLDIWMEELYRRVSDRQTMGSVVQELRSSLSEIEKQIDQYFRDPTQRQLLFPVPAQLSAMRGVLSVLGLDQASAAAVHMRDDVDALAQTEVDPRQAVQTGTFDRLADNLGALSFLIDMLSVQPALAKSLFRFDAETGNLSAVMGQSERVSAFAAFDEAGAAAAAGPAAPAAPAPAELSPLLQQLRDVAAAASDPLLTDADLAQRLGDAASSAVVDDQAELAGLLADAEHALQGGADEATRAEVRGGLAKAIAALTPTAPEPADGTEPPVASAVALAATVTAPGVAPGVAPSVPPGVPPVDSGERDLEGDAEMRDIFIEEAREVITDAHAALERLADAPDNATDLTTVRRAFHTLKGSSRMVGLTAFGDASWACEQLYNDRLAQAPRMDHGLRQFTVEALHYLAGWSEAIANGRPLGHNAADLTRAADALRIDGERLPIAAPAGAAAGPLALDATPLPVLPATEAPAEAVFETAAPEAAPPLLPELLPQERLALELEPDPELEAQRAAEPLLDTDTLAARVPDLPSAADLDLGLPELPAAAVMPPVQPALPELPAFSLDLGAFDEPAAVAEPAPATEAEAEPLAPEPAVELAPQSEPEPQPVPLPTLVVEPAPEPQPAPAPEPEPEPAPVPEPVPEPVPVPDLEALLRDLPADLPAQVPAPVPEPEAIEIDLADFDSLLAGAAEPEPAAPPPAAADAAPAPAPVPEPEPEPVSERPPLAGEIPFTLDLPAIEAPDAIVVQPGVSAAPAPEPAAEPSRALDPSIEPVFEPVAEGAFEPAPDAAAEPLFELRLDAPAEPEPVAAAEAVAPAESADVDFELTLEPAPEPASAFAPEPEPEAEAEAEPEPEALAAPALAAPALAAAPSLPEPPPADAAELDEDEQVKVIGHLRIGIPLFNIYLNEADELSRRLVTELAEWQLESERHPVPESTVALAHSLAGNSATVGYTDLSALARALEHALMRSHRARHGRPGEPELFNDAAEDIRRLLHQFAAGFLRPVAPELMHRLAEHERLPQPEAAADDDEGLGDISDTIDFELLPIFEEEADELLPQLQARLRDWFDRPADDGAPMACMRTLHTIKGGARLAGAMRLGEMAHRLETAIESLARRGGASADDIEPLLAQADAMSAAFEALRHAGAALPPAVPPVPPAPPALLLQPPAVRPAPEPEPEPVVEAEAPAVPVPDDAAGLTFTLDFDVPEPAPAALLGADEVVEPVERVETPKPFEPAEPEPELESEPEPEPEPEPEATFADAAPEPEAAPAAETVDEAAAEPTAEPTADLTPDLGDEPVAAEPVAAEPIAATAALPAEASPAEASLAEALPEPAATAAAPEPLPEAPPAPPAPAPVPQINWSRFPAAAAAEPVLATPGAERAAAGGAVVRVRSGLLDRLVNQAGEVSITRARIDSDVKQLQGSLSELTDSLERMRRQLRDIELQAETQISSRLEAAKAMSQSFDPLEMDRFTRFQELTRFMAESVNDVATLQRSLQRTLQSTEDELAAQARLTRELQDDLLRTRMVEFESMADRLHRTARQAARETGKQVRLDIVGGAIEIDRGVLERMAGPFEHLLRNSVAHGVETPEARAAAGKEAQGVITVTLAQAGNEVAVEFADDGGGLDLARIRSRAVERGLLAADAGASDDELAELVFRPGFSTAQAVTELAGRGIGLDVVRAEVNAMGGRIETHTAAGRGTRFRLLLPLTTAVTQVVMLRCGEQQVAVPSPLIEIVRRVPSAEVERAYAEDRIAYAGEDVAFFWLPALLRSGTRGEVAGRTQTVVTIRSAGQRVAVHVDEVVGNQEVVVKHVGPQLARMPGLAGVTLLPSGAVALIYNPVALAALYGDEAHGRMHQAATAADAPQPQPVAEAARVPMVMVVDDSLTVRRVTQRLLVREGYRVVTAKDGLDALEKLAEERPVVLLSDIEMPRMDGFDLVRNVRAEPRLAGLPVVMITSRIAQKHRDYAAELGVDHYLGKPFSEEELLALVARYAGADLVA